MSAERSASSPFSHTPINARGRGALPPPRPHLGPSHVHAQLAAAGSDPARPGFQAGKRFRGHHAGQVEGVADGVYMMEQIGQALSSASRFSWFSSALGTPPWLSVPGQ